MFTKIILITILSIFFIIPIDAFAHPGRTDADGGHFCRTRCTERWGLKYGEYHKHQRNRPAPRARTQSRTTSRNSANRISK